MREDGTVVRINRVIVAIGCIFLSFNFLDFCFFCPGLSDRSGFGLNPVTKPEFLPGLIAGIKRKTGPRSGYRRLLEG